MKIIVLRKQAISQGLSRYFTGKPCKRGHVSERITGSSECVTCCKDRAADFRNRNPLYTAQWNKEHKESRRISCASYRAENKEKITAYIADWSQNNQDKRRIHRANRRAKTSEGKLSADLVARLFVLQKGRCACCGNALADNYHIDHIMPLALGGEHCDKNIQLLNQKCNNNKHAKHPVDFMQERGFLL